MSEDIEKCEKCNNTNIIKDIITDNYTININVNKKDEHSHVAGEVIIRRMREQKPTPKTIEQI